VCVKKFMGLPSDPIFAAVKRVRKDGSKSLNAEAIDHAFGRGWINDWERGFSFATMRKRRLSEKQLNKRREINRKVLQNVARNRQV